MYSGDNGKIPSFSHNDEVYSTIDYNFIGNQMCPMIQSTVVHQLHSSWTNHQLFSFSVD